jgi:dTDP-4-dehydrorhamnose reductase
VKPAAVKICVLGANGQLGSDIVGAFRAAGMEVAPLTHGEIEIVSPDSIRAALGASGANVVINTAAFHNVEKCELEPASAFAVNAVGARNLAEATRDLGAALVHISTDYVFDGAKRQPYVEQDMPGPLSVYGNSKLAGEYFVRATNPRHFVVRVAAIYGRQPCRAKDGMNFVETMLKLARERGEARVVDDEFTTPTPTVQIARQLVALAASEAYGLYHATAEGSCSWYEFAAAIFELSGTKVRLQRAAPGQFSSRVERPKFSVLENAALKRRNLNRFTHWRDGLADYLSSRVTASAAV